MAGSSDVFRVDVRVLAATNANLCRTGPEKQFREDLFYRLSVFPIELPALAQRRGDVEPWRGTSCEVSSQAGGQALSPESVRLLEKHSWPGNVRELQHVIERACILAEGGAILPEHSGVANPAGPATVRPRLSRMKSI